MNKNNLKCVSLKGEISDWGKHILLPMGVTLCGMPTVDADLEMFPQLKERNLADMRFQYVVEEWSITCSRCLEMISILDTYKSFNH